MESSPKSRSGQAGEDMAIILVTAAQLIFFAYFYKYIAWPTTAPDGSVVRLSLLTDDYFTWLPIVITASMLVIVASAVMIISHSDWFRQAAWILFCILGVTVTVSLLLIYPFDFSVIPDATAAKVVPIGVTVFFVGMAIFYGATALVMFVKMRNRTAKKEAG